MGIEKNQYLLARRGSRSAPMSNHSGLSLLDILDIDNVQKHNCCSLCRKIPFRMNFSECKNNHQFDHLFTGVHVPGRYTNRLGSIALHIPGRWCL